MILQRDAGLLETLLRSLWRGLAGPATKAAFAAIPTAPGLIERLCTPFVLSSQYVLFDPYLPLSSLAVHFPLKCRVVDRRNQWLCLPWPNRAHPQPPIPS